MPPAGSRQGSCTGLSANTATPAAPLAVAADVADIGSPIKIDEKIDNPVAGKAHILVVPDVEAGNILVKSFVYLAGGRISGVVVGAAAPVVLPSRADSAESKFFSIATAVHMAQLEESRVKVGKRV